MNPLTAGAGESALQLLQGLRMKGRATTEQLAHIWGIDETRAATLLEALIADGCAEEKQGFFALSGEGELQRQRALNAERTRIDGEALKSLYADFCSIDPSFKQLVADVQLGKLERDAAAEHLAPLHEKLRVLARRATALLPRLEVYEGRFEAALAGLREGDSRYLASPIVESYHGIWFEFHEELIQASGRTRAQESIAGGGA
jgi:pyruvate,orthophosphate dikinase